MGATTAFSLCLFSSSDHVGAFLVQFRLLGRFDLDESCHLRVSVIRIVGSETVRTLLPSWKAR
jgi:hypothetical protein